ncbi:MAG: peptide-methionine (S)-S-oxide reductase MsrA [Mariprofundaceae bacterium]
MRQVVFAGGCFWCMQPPFDQIEGVMNTEVGYLGGDLPSPSYAQICSGNSGHVEAIRVSYDSRVSYEELLAVFWRQIDPTQGNGQFADHGSQYQTVIFYANEEEKSLAHSSKLALEASGKFTRPIVTEIQALPDFYRAETEHQNYYQTNAPHYQRYKKASGREGFIETVWQTDGENDDL